MVKNGGRKKEIGRVKVKNEVVKVVYIEMGKMGEKEGLKVKNKARCEVEVKKVSENGRNLMDFCEKLKVLSEVAIEVLEREEGV